MAYCYSLEHVMLLRERCRAAGCSAPSAFWTAPGEELRAYYNGIGPDSWSPRFRAWVTWLLELFEIAALPHDFEFATSPRRYWRFTLANWRFMINAAREILRMNRKLQEKLWLILCGILLALLCQFFGWKGYREVEL